MDYKKILYDSELKVLEGKGKRNIWILSTILFLMLLGLGHSIGGLQDLSKRMQNPYTRWVNLPISPNDYKNSDKLQEKYSDRLLRDSFFIDTIRGYKREYFKLGFVESTNYQFQISRSIHVEEPLLEEILKPSNVLVAHADHASIVEMDECWMILREETVRALGYNGDLKNFTQAELRQTYIAEVFDFSLYLPVVAIVHDLPDNVDMVMPEHMHEITEAGNNYGFIGSTMSNTFSFLHQSNIADQVHSFLQDTAYEVYDIEDSAFTLHEKSLVLHTVYLEKPISIKERIDILLKVQKEYGVRFYTSYECNIGRQVSVSKAQYLAINFDKLDYVRKFREAVKGEYELDISLNQVEDKENFSRISRLTTGMALMLFVISLLSIVLYIIKLVLNHIKSIKQHLGTFKAFGLPNTMLIKDYQQIIIRFIAKSFLYCIILAICYLGIAKIFDLKFVLFHWVIGVAMVLIFIVTIISLNYILKNNLDETPGNLIYDR